MQTYSAAIWLKSCATQACLGFGCFGFLSLLFSYVLFMSSCALKHLSFFLCGHFSINGYLQNVSHFFCRQITTWHICDNHYPGASHRLALNCKSNGICQVIFCCDSFSSVCTGRTAHLAVFFTENKLCKKRKSHYFEQVEPFCKIWSG